MATIEQQYILLYSEIFEGIPGHPLVVTIPSRDAMHDWSADARKRIIDHWIQNLAFNSLHELGNYVLHCRYFPSFWYLFYFAYNNGTLLTTILPPDNDVSLCEPIQLPDGEINTAKTYLGATRLTEEDIDDVERNVDSLMVFALCKS